MIRYLWRWQVNINFGRIIYGFMRFWENQFWVCFSFEINMYKSDCWDVEVETPTLWPHDAKSWLIWKDPDAGKDWGQGEKGMTEDEMVR